ncbi:MAG TPA: beta-glucosidase BglX [Vicinamibacterales bacterium]|nr:beta-glucosidase BglX [Vicinamibacterales bacterium]
MSTVLPFSLAVSLLLVQTPAAQTPAAQTPAARILIDPDTERKIDELLAQMSLDEKIGQMNQASSTFDVTGPPPTEAAQKQLYEHLGSGRLGSMLNVVGAEATRKAQQLAVEGSRHRIPLLFGLDVIHGYKTMFPIPLAEAASWDLEAIERSARIAATEASAAGIHWTFAPMVDVSRDARWGRVMEGSGEDPYLGAQIAAARVRGFQGTNLAALDTIAACVKHYAAYGFAEAGRDYNTVDLSENTLQNLVLPPFRAAVDAGAATVMNSFNEIGGIPATGSSYLQREVLKRDWGFQGFVVSDWGSIGEMVAHGFAADLRDAARAAITAGSDMDMESRAYIAHLADLVKSGAVDVRLIDEAVRRILRVKFALGLFDDPYRYSDPAREARTLLAPEHLAAARDVARKSIVLLRNERNLLPLSKSVRSIAVIGPLANDKDTPLGSWRAQAEPNSAVSVLEGIQAAVSPDTKVEYAVGAPLVVGERAFHLPLKYNTTDRSGFPAAVAAAKAADVVVMALGEDSFQSGEGRSQVDIGLKGLQEELLRAVFAVNRNVVVVLMNGRPLVLTWMAEHVPAIVEAWHLGSQAGHAIADVLFGDYNPSGKLPMSFPRHVGQLPMSYNHKSTGRPGPSDTVFWSQYTDSPNSPLYPFGFGLSYTTFTYDRLRLSANELARDGRLDVTVTLTNSGRRAGVEVVQLYIRDLVASTTRPVKELKGFQRVELKPGESRDVTFTLTPADLAFFTANRRWEAEPGEFKVFVGGNSRDVLEASFVLK